MSLRAHAPHEGRCSAWRRFTRTPFIDGRRRDDMRMTETVYCDKKRSHVARGDLEHYDKMTGYSWPVESVEGGEIHGRRSA